MTIDRRKVIVSLLLAVVTLVLIWSHNRDHDALRARLDQADGDVAAAKAAAERAGNSAAQAIDAAKAAQNKVPGSS